MGLWCLASLVCGRCVASPACVCLVVLRDAYASIISVCRGDKLMKSVIALFRGEEYIYNSAGLTDVFERGGKKESSRMLEISI